MDIEKLKFPIGRYDSNKILGDKFLQQCRKSIVHFPAKVEILTFNISKEKLNWKYRPDGWTVSQVIHHCADSHMNSLIRFKLALTENTPTIKPYFQDKWAELVDSKDDNIDDSILLLKGLHNKWNRLLNSLSKKQLELQFKHPEHQTKISLAENISIYSWHCNHHLAHIRDGIASNGDYTH